MTNSHLAPGLPPLPSRFLKLPVDHRGYPVPKFCWKRQDGTYDFRVVAPGWPETCIRNRLCWLCGERLGKFMAFVVGPMCAVNRNSAEPPSHRECAEFAVKACPFMRFPGRKRDEEGLPEKGRKPGGEDAMIMRNPGVSLIWITHGYKTYRSNGSTLIRFGDPVETIWYAHGREATREEVLKSIGSGLPILLKMAESEGPDAVKALQYATVEAMKLVPREAQPT